MKIRQATRLEKGTSTGEGKRGDGRQKQKKRNVEIEGRQTLKSAEGENSGREEARAGGDKGKLAERR